MPKPEGPRDDAFRTLGERADALEKLTARPVRTSGEAAAGEGYKLVGLLIGGAVVGLLVGLGVDALAHTRPLATIVGVLGGFALSVFLALRAAKDMSARWEVEHGPARDVPASDQDGEA